MGKALAGFEISVSGWDDGTLRAAYIRVRDGKVARTKEIIDSVLVADYSAGGDLLGIEILAPVELKDVVNLVKEDRRRTFRRFVKQSAPGRLVRCA